MITPINVDKVIRISPSPNLTLIDWHWDKTVMTVPTITKNHRQFSEGTNMTGDVPFLINIHRLAVSSTQGSIGMVSWSFIPQMSWLQSKISHYGSDDDSE